MVESVRGDIDRCSVGIYQDLDPPITTYLIATLRGNIDRPLMSKP